MAETIWRREEGGHVEVFLTTRPFNICCCNHVRPSLVHHHFAGQKQKLSLKCWVSQITCSILYGGGFGIVLILFCYAVIKSWLHEKTNKLMSISLYRVRMERSDPGGWLGRVYVWLDFYFELFHYNYIFWVSQMFILYLKWIHVR